MDDGNVGGARIVTAADRIKRGFSRIGLLGIVIGGVGVASCFVIAAYTWQFARSVSVYFNQSYVEVPLVASDSDLAVILKQTEARQDYFSRLNQPPQQATHSVDDLRAAADQGHQKEIASSLQGALAFAMCGVGWFALWWVLSWLVRGFLA